MPTVLRRGPYRIFFYSDEGDEPPHMHIRRDECEAKIWLDPISLVWEQRCKHADISRMLQLISDHRTELLKAWHDYFTD